MDTIHDDLGQVPEPYPKHEHRDQLFRTNELQETEATETKDPHNQESSAVTNGQPDEEPDEDVREAKANIKGYLDRIRETEKFIKSMQEEEEKSQRQRQESFLFNNLILSTKLNGFKSNGQPHGSRLDLAPTTNRFEAGTCGPFSAPVTMSRASYDSHHGDELHSNGTMGPNLITMMPKSSISSMGPASMLNYESGSGRPNGSNCDLSSAVSCFHSDLYKPASSISTPLSLQTHLASGPTMAYRDPLEPVQPISMQAYAPTRNWHRSKSQLGDRFQGSADSSSFVSPGRRPLSASIDCQSTSNPYFPSRHRRSVSQARYQQASSATLNLRSSLEASLDDPTLMMSEYKSSFGPNLRHQRHHSLAPTSPCRGSQVRAASPFKSATLTNEKDLDDDEDEDDDLGMSAYRPSSYVPRVVPSATTAAEDRVSRNRTGGGFMESRHVTSRGRSVSRSNDVIEVSGRDKSPALRSETIARRRSVQTLADSSSSSRKDDGSDVGAELATTTRRRSWTTTNETTQSTASSNGASSRLSELEQRIQANKRRREELLQGINSAAIGSEQRARPATVGGKTSSLVRPDTGKSDDDDELGQSCGFERPSRPVEREPPIRQQSPRIGGSVPSPDKLTSQDTKSYAASSSTARFRPSRLESMEARIKRKSYCVRVRSPERRASKCDGQRS